MACIVMYAVFLVSSITCTCMVYSMYMCIHVHGLLLMPGGEPLLVQGVTVHTCRWIRFLNLITVYVCACICLSLD